MDHALVDVLEVLEVVVVLLLEFLGDGNSLLHEAGDVMQYHEVLPQMNRIITSLVGDLELGSQLRAVVKFSEGGLQFFLELLREFVYVVVLDRERLVDESGRRFFWDH